MRKTIFLFAGMICLLLSVPSFAGMSVEFTRVTTIDGKTIEAETLQHGPVVLSFMAHWCPSCRVEAYELQKAYSMYKGEDVQFLALFIRSSDKGIKQFVERNRMEFSAGQDTGLARELGVWSIPVTFFIAKDGLIKRRYPGQLSQSAIRLGIEEIQK